MHLDTTLMQHFEADEIGMWNYDYSIVPDSQVSSNIFLQYIYTGSENFIGVWDVTEWYLIVRLETLNGSELFLDLALWKDKICANYITNLVAQHAVVSVAGYKTSGTRYA